LTALSTNEKKVFLADVIVEIEKICKYNRFDIDDDLIQDLAKRICKSNIHYERKLIIAALDDFYTTTFDFFSPMILFNHVNEKVAYMARKRFQEKQKKENESRLLNISSELTEEQEAERLRKKKEFEDMLKPMEERTVKFKGFRKPFDDEDFKEWKKKNKL
jgi:hypothetical protein